MVNDFVSLLFPRCCLISGAPLARGEQHVSMSAIRKLPRFDLCQTSDALMQRMFTFAPVKHTLAFYKFNKQSGVQRLLHQLKYKNCPEVGVLAGNWFGHALIDAGYTDQFDKIIPIPLHRARQRQRGYNQSDCIARGLSEALCIPWSRDTIHRIKQTATQTRKGRWERSRDTANIFSLLSTNTLVGQRILLVDDVLTTGATLGAGVRVLLEGGCSEVSVAALAAPEY